MLILKPLILVGAMLNAATLFVEGEEQEVTALQPDEVPGINEVSAFHSIKSKTNDLAVRVLEADGSATVARNPVELFLVITNDTGGARFAAACLAAAAGGCRREKNHCG
jgi:hypothetical protein